MAPKVKIDCLKGHSAQREVLLGFADAGLLHRWSFADVLQEDSGRGYQRPINARHSADFRHYIRKPGSSTIPLTLNLRRSRQNAWTIVEGLEGRVWLEIDPSAKEIMAQVDCQHRLGHLQGVHIPLPFMCFLGLSVREEMEVFSIINSKAKGLSRSLLDNHAVQLLSDSLAEERPELYIAIQLNNLEESPWYKRLKLGGASTSGLRRIVSLRMMQQAIAEFLKSTDILHTSSAETATSTVLDFWLAVQDVLSEQWEDPRHHVLTKGIGLYALMTLASDVVLECRTAKQTCDKTAFTSALADFVWDFDWSTQGSFKGLGGKAGVSEAVQKIRRARRRACLEVVNGE